MSRIISSAPVSATGLVVATAVGANSVAVTTSVGSGTLAPRAFMPSMMVLASATRSFSASDLPIGEPSASRKVLAMPPPTMSWSTFSDSDLRIVSLVETFEPATIATSGRAGAPSALPSASSSAASSGPAQAMGANFAMPCVVASARWAVPKASLA